MMPKKTVEGTHVMKRGESEAERERERYIAEAETEKEYSRKGREPGTQQL